ncbi:MAG: aldo/keto reductase [Caulobacterales bacterium]
MNEWQPCARLLELADPDLFLLAGRYTLLEQAPLFSLFPACERRGVGIVIGGPYNSGVLAREGGAYDYAAAPVAVLSRVRALDKVCREFGEPLAAVALAFVAAPPVVVSVIPGAQTADEVRANTELSSHTIPAGLWDRLKAEGLIDPAAPTTRVASPR